MSAFALEQPALELPHDAVGVCDECGEPACELVTGLCERCRCVDCGSPAAPVEYDGARLCRCCATDREVYPPIYYEAAE